MKQYFLLFCFLFTSIISSAQVKEQLFFENSPLSYSFARSEVHYQGKAWVRNYQQHLPVSNRIFLTPGNALELSYRSDRVGSWHVDLWADAAQGFQVPADGHLFLRIYMEDDIPLDALPQIQILQGAAQDSAQLNFKDYLRKNPDGPWSKVEIPLSDFPGFQADSAIWGLRLQQGKPTDQDYTLYIDQVEILPNDLPDTKLTGAAVLSEVKAYPNHAVLHWKLPLTPSIRYIQIYRSQDKVNFTPVAIQAVPNMYYTDILPDTTKTYYYKIAWVDYDYQTSPFSEVKAVKSRPMDTQALLDMVQRAHIRYYLSGLEYNSGMQRAVRKGLSRAVSVKGTGMGLMAMLVGVRQQMLSRSQYRDKVDQTCDFLLNARSFQGAFPAILDGKTGEGVALKVGEQVQGDLYATAYLMQGLLVAREYFRDSSEEDGVLRAKIDTLWRRVEWNKFKKEGEPYLYNTWNPEDGLSKAAPISGLPSLPVYLLAMASPTHNIDIEDYAEGMAEPLVFQPLESQLGDSLHSEHALDQDSLWNAMENTSTGAWVAKPYVNPEVIAGIDLNLNREIIRLPDALMAFTAFDPRGKRDAFVDYAKELSKWIRIQKRMREEQGTLRMVLKEGFGVALGDQLDFNANVATYAFTPKIAQEYVESYYSDLAALSWSGYGFLGQLDLDAQRYVPGEDVALRALVPIMIENGKTGMIWKLFMQVPELQTILKSIYMKDTP